MGYKRRLSTLEVEGKKHKTRDIKIRPAMSWKNCTCIAEIGFSIILEHKTLKENWLKHQKKKKMRKLV